MPRDAALLPPPPDELWASVEAGLPQLGVELEPALRAALDVHVRLLLAWNEHVNLTALRTPQQIARGHLLDSLSGVPLLRRLWRSTDGTGPALLDLGSGGGYPGLPLALVLPAARCALVDSVRKKAAFLGAAAAAAVAAVGDPAAPAPHLPHFSTLAERAEDLAQEPDQREAWDFVVARAVGSLPEVLELALPLTRVGGHVVVWKREAEAAGLRDEINASRALLRAAGGEHPFVIAPDRHDRAGLGDRRLVVVRKLRATPERFPRAPAERRRRLLR